MNTDPQDGDGVDIGKKHKLGHLRVDTQGNATFKRLPTNQLVEALQLGIQYSVGGLEARPAHDVLFQDFLAVEIIHFPKGGRLTPKATPPHRFNDFTIRSYAPVAFRHFREKFNIKPADYLSSICRPFRELKNPGASGSLFYLTSDDEFIIKTVQKREAEFLKTLLPGYYMNIIQNQRTLLPKFFGLYCYQGENKNIRITVMNNLIPSHVQMHEKYDLKGSTYKRLASQQERQKESPTWKDLDFMERHPKGLVLDPDTYNALQKTVQRDCRVLASFHIMDYSFLIGVHRVDQPSDSPGDGANASGFFTDPSTPKPKRMMYSTPMDNIQAQFDEDNTFDDHLVKTGGIPARTADGERLSLYVGIIDILQSYQLRKKLEHTLKTLVTDGTQISVTHPNYYSERFQKFLFNTVFKKAPQRTSKLMATIAESDPTINVSNSNTPSTINSSVNPFRDKPYMSPPHLNYKNSTSSTETTNSRITSYYTSLRSSRPSKDRNKLGSSTTLYGSSHQSDSLFNEPTRKKPARVFTTTFANNQTNNPTVKFHQESLNYDGEKRQNLLPIGGGIVGKLAASTTNLTYRSNLPNYSSMHHQSSDEINIMTASEQLTTDLYHHQASCMSSNVGSIADFLFTSTHSMLNNDEQVLEHSKQEDISICENDNEPPSELNVSGNKEKLGHRRVDEIGNVTYKRVMVDDLMKSLQLGLNYVIGKHHQPQRQVLFQDFQQIEYQDFPPEGSKSTPKHPYAEFRLKTYAQTAFRFFRNTFGVDPSSFMLSLCAKDLRELPNPGASGSIFYITSDDAYIIKTVSKKEARFLLSILAGYYMNLTQNPFTLLPKFFGLYCYQSSNKNIRFVIMNNLVPTNVKLHEKYDLKGSIYKRKASEEEHKRDLPTLKDNDFKCLHAHGLTLEPFFYDQLMQTIEDDVRVLRSFGIMDYSLLLAAHNITEEMKTTHKLTFPPSREIASLNEPTSSDIITHPPSSINEEITTTSTDSGIAMTIISNLPTYMQYLRVIEFIRAQQEPSIINIERSLSANHIETASIKTVKAELSPPLDTHFKTISRANEQRLSPTNVTFRVNNRSPIHHSTSTTSSFHSANGLIGGDVWYHRQNLSRLAMAGVPAVNQNGDLLLLYVGIIDILQNYRLRKKLEHAFKSTLVTREEISVCNPNHYGDRFVRFLTNKVFRKGGPNGNTLLSDSQSNTDQITLHSSRLLNPSSLYRSQMSDDNSSITNNNNEIHMIKS